MADCHLTNRNPVPPGGFRLYLRDVNGRPIYIHNGRKRTDILQNFDMETLIVQGVEFRRGNNVPGASREEVALDISRDTCKELGCDKRVCSDGSPIIHETERRSGCAGCGSPGIR